MNKEARQIIDERLWHEMMPPDNFSGEISFMEPMKYHTSLKIGGAADIFVSPHNAVSLRNLLLALEAKEIPFMPVGGGTNLLVRDGGIDGVVISLKNLRRLEIIREEDDIASLLVESGVPLQKLVVFSKENGFSGLEGLIGIPGFIGGAVAGNAESFGYAINNVLASSRMMLANGNIKDMTGSELGLKYRASKIPPDAVVLSANIKIKRDKREDIAKRMDGFIKERREKQPLSELSAGCVFKNPEGASAGRLIDEAGCKGMKIGDVVVSSLHANFFINKGNASASDFIELMERVRTKVMAVFGIALEPEIRITGREC